VHLCSAVALEVEYDAAMSAAVGSDVEALCSKCGDVWHVVFAKTGEKIVRVQCKQCSGYHRYKSPAGAALAGKAPKAPRAPRAPRDPVERFERASIQADMSKPIVPYRASARYTVADRVEHPTFGTGTVEIVESGKITVFFATGRKVLASSKEINGEQPGGLTRPKKFDHANPPAGGKPVGPG
jgi:hypothetical protein